MKLLIYLSFPLLFLGCLSDTSSIKKEMVQDDLKDAERYLQIVQTNNQKRPAYISADISITASIKGKTFKSVGTLNYTISPQTLRAKLVDAIFRSIMADMFLENGVLKMYVPVDNTVYIRHSDMDISESIEIDPRIISSTALSIIPLISDAKPIRLYRESTNSKDSIQRIVVLENSIYYESLFFTGDLPEKILLISKTNGEKTEIHYKNPVLNDGITFYTLVNISSEKSGNSAEISFSNLKLNEPFDRNRVFNFIVPKGTKIIEQ
jgi:hypothetical protein